MPRLISGSTLRRGGSGEFLDLRGAMPQLPTSPSTSTGYTLVTDDLLRTTYRSSLGNLEFNLGEVWSNLPDGVIRLVGTGTGFVYVAGFTESVSTDTGALVVQGGLGIGGSLWTNNDIHVNDLTIGQGFEGVNNIVMTGNALPLSYEYDYPVGESNIAIGYDALPGIAASIKSIAIGRYALGEGQDIVKSVAIGDSALKKVGTVPAGFYQNIENITLSPTISISGATNDNPVVVTAVGHGLSTGTRISIQNVVGLSTTTLIGTETVTISLVNDQSFYVDALSVDTLALYNANVFTTATSVDGTLTNWSSYTSDGIVVVPVIVQVTNHGYSTGTNVILEDITGTEELNASQFWIYPISDNTFQLYTDNILFTGLDGSSLTAYDSGGTVHRVLLKDNNIAVGTNAGTSLYDGEQNFFFGDNIAPNLTTGSYNFFMGHDVATNMTNGSGNISIMGDNLQDGQDNQVNIGGIFYYDGNGYLQLNADTGLGLGTASTSTTTGALVVNGGVGITGDLWIGGTVHGNIAISGNADNLAGGSAGSLVYQTGTNYTGFIAIGSTGTLLMSDGVNPYWGTPPGLSSTATNAENIFVNTTLPSSSYYLGLTELLGDFSPVDSDPNLIFDTTDNRLTSVRLSITSTDTSVSTTTGQAMLVAGGIGVEKDIYVAQSVYSREGGSNHGNLLYTPRVTVSVTPPTTATNRVGDFWINGSGIALQWIADGTSTFWLQIGA